MLQKAMGGYRSRDSWKLPAEILKVYELNHSGNQYYPLKLQMNKHNPAQNHYFPLNRR